MVAFQDLDPTDLKKLLDGGSTDLLLVDVRTPTEVARGAIPGARSIPLHLLPLNAGVLDKDRSVVFYCQSGGRSSQACAYLHQQGYGKLYNLRGGIMAWVRNGLPLEPLA
ncbi:MAG: rhodanese-like domain-containing protein [Acidiferrobacter sp.]